MPSSVVNLLDEVSRNPAIPTHYAVALMEAEAAGLIEVLHDGNPATADWALHIAGDSQQRRITVRLTSAGLDALESAR
jgi:hypothetical protein